MDYTYKFYVMATLPTSIRTVLDYKPRFHLGRLAGCIGEHANNKEEFIRAGLRYHDTFKERVKALMPPPSLYESDCNIISDLIGYLERFKGVNRQKYATLLSEHWDKNGSKPSFAL